jgi:hypothetical protein
MGWSVRDRHRDGGQGPGDLGGSADAGHAPGKRALTDDLAYASQPVQRKAAGGAPPPAANPTAIAQAGTQGAGGPLPHLDQIQRSFGRIDLSNVRAHEGGAAGEAAGALGAEAFAVGDAVGFSGAPDLHTAAHEAAHVVQQRNGVQLKGGIDGGASDPYERQADAAADAVVRGESAEHLLGGGGASSAAGTPAVQRKTTVNPVTLATEDKAAVFAKTIPDFHQYIKQQADWFTHPDFSTAATAAVDRAKVWKVAKLCARGFHVTSAMPTFTVADVAALAAGDAAKLDKYIECFDSSAMTIQLSTAAPTVARALQLGQALIDLAIVPGPVMKIVIPEAGFIDIVDTAKVAELKKYYTTFAPTLETAGEWDHVRKLLDGGLTKYASLAGWIHDLHTFTEATLDELIINVKDRGRTKPVTLILFSALDWNAAFQQGTALEGVVKDKRNLALIVQGPASIAAATSEVERVANEYGQLVWSWDPKKSWLPTAKGRLGQVVIAGHGSEHGVEMASDGTGAWADEANGRVGYAGNDIDRNDSKKNGTDELFKTVIEHMDPADVNIVFAGCLVNSHEIPATTPISSNAKTAQKNLQAALKKHPNLAEYVRAKMASMGATGTVAASNASTQFDSFGLDGATGKMTIDNKDDPDLGHSKLDYLKTGVEGEGVLRAAIECFADPAIGPAKTTTEIRTRVAAAAASNEWFTMIVRVGLEVCLPSAGDVSAAKLNDVAHRIRPWGEMYWADVSSVEWMSDSTKKGEETKLYPAMLASDIATNDQIAVGVNEAWLKFDATKGAAMMTALTASSYPTKTLGPTLVRKLVDKHLSTLLPPSASPTTGQLRLALTIASQDGKGMPKAVRDFLRAAAGGAKTTTFPAALSISTILDTAGEDQILDDIGLSPTAPVVSGSTVSVDGNVDTNADGTKDSYVEVTPFEAAVTVSVLNVRAKPNGAITDTVKKGDVVRVMGMIHRNSWAMIDHGGNVGYVFTKYLKYVP